MSAPQAPTLEATVGATAPTTVVLYRCPTPTNLLCPCGAVARRLRKLGIEHRTERVPYRRSMRPEVAELTHQRRVPLLIDGGEIVHDSRRILEWLDYAHGPDRRPAARSD